MILGVLGTGGRAGGSGSGDVSRTRCRAFSGSTVSATSVHRWKSARGGFLPPPVLTMVPPGASGELVGRNQLPVGIAGFGAAREGPLVGDELDLIGIALDQGALLVAGGGDHFGVEAHGHPGVAAVELSLGDLDL